VAASLQVLVNSEFQTGLVAADSATQVEGLKSIDLGKYYNPLESRLNKRIDHPVRAAKVKELRALVAAYPAPDGATKLLERFLEQLQLSTLSAEKKTAIEEQVKGIVADAETNVSEKVRLLGIQTYSVLAATSRRTS
jgi:hypothetical protein